MIHISWTCIIMEGVKIEILKALNYKVPFSFVIFYKWTYGEEKFTQVFNEFNDFNPKFNYFWHKISQYSNYLNLECSWIWNGEWPPVTTLLVASTRRKKYLNTKKQALHLQNMNQIIGKTMSLLRRF